MTKKYTGGGIREYILEMSHVANKLKTMDMSLPDPFIVQLMFKSIPKDFSTFHVNYNTQPGNRNVEKLFTMCCQKVDRLKAANGGELVFHVQQKTRTIKTIRNFSRLLEIRRNMISRFGDGKCEIQFNKECVGLAFRQDKIYLLSLSENVNVASSKNKNSSSYENVTMKRK